MSASIKLLESRQVLELLLSPTYNTYSGVEPVDVVYQDAKYDFELDIIDVDGDICDVHIIVNNKQLELDFSNAIKDDEGKYYFSYNRCAFDMVYGITEIIVEIEFCDRETQYFFSGHLAIAINQKYERTMDSICEMLDDIYKKDHTLRKRWNK